MDNVDGRCPVCGEPVTRGECDTYETEPVSGRDGKRWSMWTTRNWRYGCYKHPPKSGTLTCLNGSHEIRYINMIREEVVNVSTGSSC